MNCVFMAGKGLRASGTVQAMQEIMMAQGMDEAHYARQTAAAKTTRDTVRASGRAGNQADAGARAGFPKRAGYSDRDVTEA